MFQLHFLDTVSALRTNSGKRLRSLARTCVAAASTWVKERIAHARIAESGSESEAIINGR